MLAELKVGILRLVPESVKAKIKQLVISNTNMTPDAALNRRPNIDLGLPQKTILAYGSVALAVTGAVDLLFQPKPGYEPGAGVVHALSLIFGNDPNASHIDDRWDSTATRIPTATRKADGIAVAQYSSATPEMRTPLPICTPDINTIYRPNGPGSLAMGGGSCVLEVKPATAVIIKTATLEPIKTVSATPKESLSPAMTDVKIIQTVSTRLKDGSLILPEGLPAKESISAATEVIRAGEYTYLILRDKSGVDVGVVDIKTGEVLHAVGGKLQVKTSGGNSFYFPELVVVTHQTTRDVDGGHLGVNDKFTPTEAIQRLTKAYWLSEAMKWYVDSGTLAKENPSWVTLESDGNVFIKRSYIDWDNATRQKFYDNVLTKFVEAVRKGEDKVVVVATTIIAKTDNNISWTDAIGSYAGEYRGKISTGNGYRIIELTLQTWAQAFNFPSLAGDGIGSYFRARAGKWTIGSGYSDVTGKSEFTGPIADAYYNIDPNQKGKGVTLLTKQEGVLEFSGR